MSTGCENNSSNSPTDDEAFMGSLETLRLIKDKSEQFGLSEISFLVLMAIASGDNTSCDIVNNWYERKAGTVLSRPEEPLTEFAPQLDELEAKGFLWVSPPEFDKNGNEVKGAEYELFGLPEDNPHFTGQGNTEQ